MLGAVIIFDKAERFASAQGTLSDNFGVLGAVIIFDKAERFASAQGTLRDNFGALGAVLICDKAEIIPKHPTHPTGIFGN